MAIPLSDGFRGPGKPLESKYLSPSNAAWADVAAVNAGILPAERHVGLTVLIGTAEFWYSPTTADGDLVEKTAATGGGGGGDIDVVDSLASTSTTDALSANQGRVLNIGKANLSGGNTFSGVNVFNGGLQTAGLVSSSGVTVAGGISVDDITVTGLLDTTAGGIDAGSVQVAGAFSHQGGSVSITNPTAWRNAIGAGDARRGEENIFTAANTFTTGTFTGNVVAETNARVMGTLTLDNPAAGSITGNAGTVTTIAGKISSGTNVSITGAGTTASPYVINSAGGGGGSIGLVDNLTSTSTTSALSANMGRVLDDKFGFTGSVQEISEGGEVIPATDLDESILINGDSETLAVAHICLPTSPAPRSGAIKRFYTNCNIATLYVRNNSASGSLIDTFTGVSSGKELIYQWFPITGWKMLPCDFGQNLNGVVNLKSGSAFVVDSGVTFSLATDSRDNLKTALNLSGTNTGDQDLSGLVPKADARIPLTNGANAASNHPKELRIEPSVTGGTGAAAHSYLQFAYYDNSNTRIYPFVLTWTRGGTTTIDAVTRGGVGQTYYLPAVGGDLVTTSSNIYGKSNGWNVPRTLFGESVDGTANKGQDLRSTAAPTFAGLTLAGDLLPDVGLTRSIGSVAKPWLHGHFTGTVSAPGGSYGELHAGVFQVPDGEVILGSGTSFSCTDTNFTLLGTAAASLRNELALSSLDTVEFYQLDTSEMNSENITSSSYFSLLAGSELDCKAGVYATPTSATNLRNALGIGAADTVTFGNLYASVGDFSSSISTPYLSVVNDMDATNLLLSGEFRQDGSVVTLAAPDAWREALNLGSGTAVTFGGVTAPGGTFQNLTIPAGFPNSFSLFCDIIYTNNSAAGAWRSAFEVGMAIPSVNASSSVVLSTGNAGSSCNTLELSNAGAISLQAFGGAQLKPGQWWAITCTSTGQATVSTTNYYAGTATLQYASGEGPKTAGQYKTMIVRVISTSGNDCVLRIEGGVP